MKTQILAGIFVVVMIIVGLLSNTAMASECDFCVCKGKDTENSCTKCCSDKAAIKEVLKLKISDDGKTIVDQNNNEVAKFKEDMNVKSSDQKLQGCMCCKQECIVYDANGKCIKTYNSCTWDFDCNCSK